MDFTIIVTATFGLEAIVAKELKELGYEDLEVENGKVTFKGDEMDIVTCNMWLRTADRVQIQLAKFKAVSFEELFQGTSSVNWGDIIPENGFMHVEGKSIKSILHSVPDCQSIVKKAVVEGMKKKYDTLWFSEDGSEFKIEVGILKDIVVLTLDTTGAGLHKRGYRTLSGEAPIKETLAAALVLISKWDADHTLADPMCGSGTIAIEAALIGKNMAPGLNRKFVSEDWDIIPKNIWEDTRRFAKNAVNDKKLKILASDIDWTVLKNARENAEKAGVSDCITFQKVPLQDFSSHYKKGFIITNPPYGARLGEAEEVEILYKEMGETFLKLDRWSYFIITSHPEFEKLFGEKSTKNRKLYNGRIKCYYYQYINF